MKMMFGTLIECGSVLEKYIQQHVDDKDGVDIKNVLGKVTLSYRY